MASRKNPDTTKKSKKKDAQAEKKPVGKRRDAEGNWIGDDGLDMTPARKRLHHLFDAYFIWGIILALAAVVFLVLSYFQGAQYQTWELVASGGNQFNGWDTALLMRYETVFLLLSGVVFILANFFGFAWLYDRKPDTRLRVALIALIAVSAVYFLLAVVRVGTPAGLADQHPAGGYRPGHPAAGAGRPVSPAGEQEKEGSESRQVVWRSPPQAFTGCEWPGIAPSAQWAGIP